MKIVTDSTSDLPEEIVEEYGIEIVPLTVRLGDKVFRDYYDVSPAEFYQMLRETDDFPRTSQPSVEEFISTYKKIGDKEDIISIHISTKMSATAQSASLALQQLPGWKVGVIDSGLVSVGLGILVIEAAKAAKAGADAREVFGLVERLMSKIKVYFSVDSLDFLQKGGRIGRAAAFLGTMLKIKPLLDVSGGIVSPVEKLRGTSKLIGRMVDIVKEDSSKHGDIVAGFIYGESEENVSNLISQLSNSVKYTELYRRNIGTVITSHAGPTAFAIGYYCKNDEERDNNG